MRSQCQHTNSRLMEYWVISSDGHLSKHYVSICICTRYVLESSFISFQSVINFIEYELFWYPEQPLQIPLSAHTSSEHWSLDIRSSYWWCRLLLIMVSYSCVRNKYRGGKVEGKKLVKWIEELYKSYIFRVTCFIFIYRHFLKQ